MTRRAVLLILVAAFAFGACSGKEWAREGASEADLARAEKACFEESGYRETNLASSRYVKRCLAERGWIYAVPPPQAAAPTQAYSSESSVPAAADSGSSMSFDECFERCRALTDRSKEACFDACLGGR